MQLNEKMSEMVANHKSVISQKDKQLADLQTQVDTLQKAETDLTVQIEEQKAKNNVSLTSSHPIRLQHPNHPSSLEFKFWWFI